jgi:hypothetical protein
MKTLAHLVFGTLSSVLLAIGLARLAQVLDPLSRCLGNQPSSRPEAPGTPSTPCGPAPLGAFPPALF